jgi:hypothetical protein
MFDDTEQRAPSRAQRAESIESRVSRVSSSYVVAVPVQWAKKHGRRARPIELVEETMDKRAR